MGSGNVWWTLASGAAGLVVMACWAARNLGKSSGIGFWRSLKVVVLGGGGPGGSDKPPQ